MRTPFLVRVPVPARTATIGAPTAAAQRRSPLYRRFVLFAVNAALFSILVILVAPVVAPAVGLNLQLAHTSVAFRAGLIGLLSLSVAISALLL